MSLEDKIQGLREAIDSLTAALTVPGIKPFIPANLPGAVGAPEKKAEAEVAPPKPKTTPEIIPAAATPIASAGPSVEEPAPSLTIDYAQVAKAITDTFKVDRAKTIAALGKFGAAKGPQLKPEDYAAFLKELTS